MAATLSGESSLPISNRRHGLAVMPVALSRTIIPIISGAVYAVIIALLVGALDPNLAKADMGPYLSSPAIVGLLGGQITEISGMTIVLAMYLYSSFYGLLYGGIAAYVSGMAIPRNIENGMLDLALARPISRTRYYFENWGAMLISALLLSLVTISATWVGTLLSPHPDVNWHWLWITQGIQTAFLVFAVGLGMLLGSFFNSSRSSGWAGVGIIMLAYLFNTLGALSDKYSLLLKISPFHYAPGIDPLVYHKVIWWYPDVLILAGLVLGIAGLFIFRKRDLPVA